VLSRKERSTASTNPEDMRYFVSGAQAGEITNNGANDPAFQDYAQALKARNIEPSSTPAPFRLNTTAPVLRGAFGTSAGYDYVNPVGDGANSTNGSYTVREGETLQSVAANAWGDAAMWYLIAQANGLSAGASLTAGQSLIIPDRVTNIHNNASTFEVYDPNRALGDLSPSSPKLPKKAGKCAMIGMILLVVIAVAVSAAVISCLSDGGQGWIRTSVRETRADLQSAAFNHSATCPVERARGRRVHWRKAPALSTHQAGQRPAIVSAKPCHAALPISGKRAAWTTNMMRPPQIHTLCTRPRVRQS
jgi:hypothetical protein